MRAAAKKMVKPQTAAFVIPFWSDGRAYRLKYLGQAIQSIEQQTDNDWHIYITDDGSTSNRDKQVLAEMGRRHPKITVLFSAENRGAGSARNKAIARAYQDGCPFVCFLDSDDLAAGRRVEKVKSIFTQAPGIAVVYSSFNIIDEESEPVPAHKLLHGIRSIINEIEARPLNGADVWMQLACERETLTIPSALNVRTVLAHNIPFPAHFFFHEDTHTWLRYSASGAVVHYTPDIPAAYRIPQASCGSESRQRAGGLDAFNKLRSEVVMEGLHEAIIMGLKRGIITHEQAEEIKVRFLLNIAASIYKEGSQDIAGQLINQARGISLAYYECYYDKYPLPAGLK